MVELKTSALSGIGESLFDKFGISTNTSKSDLMRFFQMKPELRKELPVYIKTIKDDKKLYQEELLSKGIDGRLYGFDDYLSELGSVSGRKQLAACLSFLGDFEDNLNEAAAYWYCFVDLLSKLDDIDYSSGFQYSTADSSGEIAKGFIEKIWSAIESELSSAASGLDVATINKLYDAFDYKPLKKRGEHCQKVLCESCAAFFDTVPSRMEDRSVISKAVSIIKALDTRIVDGDAVYPSVKQCCVSLLCSLEEKDDVILPIFSELTLPLREKDRESAENVFSNYCAEFVFFDNIDKITYRRIHSVEDDIAKCSAFLKKHCPSCEETLFADVILALCTLFVSDYLKYRRLIKDAKTGNNLSATLYDLCSLVAQSKALSDYKIPYFNLLSEALGFEYEVNEIARLLDNWRKAVENIADQRKWDDYSDFIEWYPGDILTVDKIESFTCSYYALSILNPDLAEFFHAIRNSVFDILSLSDYVPTDTYQYDRTKLPNPRGEFIRDFLLMLPGDWPVGDDTVDWLLKNNFYVSRGSNRRDSDSLPYIRKCDKARNEKPKGNKIKSVKCDIPARKITKGTSQADKRSAIESVKVKARSYIQGKEAFLSAASQKEYEAASRLLVQAGGYRDAAILMKKSDEQAEICRKNAVYDKAVLKQGKDGITNLREAARLFASIPNWKDSDKRKRECTERAGELTRKQIYNDAVAAMNSANTEKSYLSVAEIFKGLGIYRDAQALRKNCEESAEVCRKDEILVSAKKIAKRNTLADLKKALGLFESITGWKDADIEKGHVHEELTAIMQVIYDAAIDKASKANTQAEYLSAASALEPILDFKDSKWRKKGFEAKAEACRKDAIYQQATNLMGNLHVSGKVSDVSKLKKAQSLFDSILDWKDSRQKSAECRDGADRIVKEDYYTKATQQKLSASDEAGFKTAATLFEKADDFKDAKSQKAACEESAEACRKDAVISFAVNSLAEVREKRVKGKAARALLVDVDKQLSELSGWKNAAELAAGCKKLKRRTSTGLKVAVLLCIAALIAVFASIAAFAATRTTVDGVEYKKHGDTAEVIGCDAGIGDISVPASIDGHSVISIGGFSGNTDIVEVTLPDGITAIDPNAFEGCSKLERVYIPDTVTAIGANAFSGCRALKEVSIPSQVTRIASYTFKNCESLGSVKISSGVQTIEVGAFDGCSSLASLDIPKSVTSIASSSFLKSMNLTYGGFSKQEVHQAASNQDFYIENIAINPKLFTGKEASAGMQFVIVNDSDKQIRNAFIDVCAWTSKGEPAKLYNPSDPAFYDTYDCDFYRTVKAGSSWSAFDDGGGWMVEDSCVRDIDTLRAVVRSVTYSDGSTWYNPYYDAWLLMVAGQNM